MPDQIFESSRLVAIYDEFDGQRKDLEHYLAIAKELQAASVLDIGSGTGCLALQLRKHGFDVTDHEPAKASLDFGRLKPQTDKISWILGEARGCSGGICQFPMDLFFR